MSRCYFTATIEHALLSIILPLMILCYLIAAFHFCLFSFKAKVDANKIRANKGCESFLIKCIHYWLRNAEAD
jgi:hypothetical protein